MEAIAAIGLTVNTLKAGFDAYSVRQSRLAAKKIEARDEAKSKLTSHAQVWSIVKCNGQLCGQYCAYTVCNKMKIYWSPEWASLSIHEKYDTCHVCKCNTKNIRPYGKFCPLSNEKAHLLSNEEFSEDEDELFTGVEVSLFVARLNLKKEKLPSTSYYLGEALYFHKLLLKAMSYMYYRNCILFEKVITKLLHSEESLSLLQAITYMTECIKEERMNFVNDCRDSICENLAQMWEELIGTSGEELDKTKHEKIKSKSLLVLSTLGFSDIDNDLCSPKYKTTLWDYLIQGRCINLETGECMKSSHDNMLSELKKSKKPLNLAYAMANNRKSISSIYAEIIKCQTEGNKLHDMHKYIESMRGITYVYQVALNNRKSIMYDSPGSRSICVIDGVKCLSTVYTLKPKSTIFQTPGIVTAKWSPDGGFTLVQESGVVNATWSAYYGFTIRHKVHIVCLHDLLVLGSGCNGRLILPWQNLSEKYASTNCWKYLRATKENLHAKSDNITDYELRTHVAMIPAPVAAMLIYSGYGSCVDESKTDTHISLHINKQPSSSFSINIEAEYFDWLQLHPCGYINEIKPT